MVDQTFPGGGAKPTFGTPTGRTTGGDRREHTYPTRLVTPLGSADFVLYLPEGLEIKDRASEIQEHIRIKVLV